MKVRIASFVIVFSFVIWCTHGQLPCWVLRQAPCQQLDSPCATEVNRVLMHGRIILADNVKKCFMGSPGKTKCDIKRQDEQVVERSCTYTCRIILPDGSAKDVTQETKVPEYELSGDGC